MTLHELLEALQAAQAIPASRVKDVKTSLRYLARALGKPSPGHCQAVDAFQPDWKMRLDTYFTTLPSTPSVHTIRNTRNNLSFTLRQARATELLSPPQTTPPQTISLQVPGDAAWRLMSSHTSYRQRVQRQQTPYHCTFQDWPPVIQEAWRDYLTDRSIDLRAATAAHMQEHLEAYLGFLINVQGSPVTSWDDLFTLRHLQAFVTWHSQRAQVRMTRRAQQIAKELASIAHSQNRPDHLALRRYASKLPTPEPLHEKKFEEVSLQGLEDIGLELLKQAHTPLSTRMETPRRGSARASTCSHALMIRLLVRVPLRQRNLREMKLDQNLYKDSKGWHLSFTAEELKTRSKGNRINQFHVNLTEYCPEIIPHLEEYISNCRPSLLSPLSGQHVFLTRHGAPLRKTYLCQRFKAIVYRYTKRSIHPHLVRHLWATNYIKTSTDPDPFTTVAFMLNNSVASVITYYQDIYEEEQLRKAQRFMQNSLRQEAKAV